MDKFGQKIAVIKSKSPQLPAVIIYGILLGCMILILASLTVDELNTGDGEAYGSTTEAITYSCGWDTLTVDFDGSHTYSYDDFDDDDNQVAGQWYLAFTILAFITSIIIFIPYILKFVANCHESLDGAFNFVKSKQIVLLKFGMVLTCIFLLVACIIWSASHDCCQAFETYNSYSFGITCDVSISWYLTLFTGLVAMFEALYIWIAWNADKTESTEYGGQGYDAVE